MAEDPKRSSYRDELQAAYEKIEALEREKQALRNELQQGSAGEFRDALLHERKSHARERMLWHTVLGLLLGHLLLYVRENGPLGLVGMLFGVGLLTIFLLRGIAWDRSSEVSSTEEEAKSTERTGVRVVPAAQEIRGEELMSAGEKKWGAEEKPLPRP